MLPAAILTVIIVNYLYDSGTVQLGYGELLIDLSNSDGFGGHYILGPVYLLFRFAASFGLGLSVAMLIAPKYNLLVGYTLFVLLILGAIGLVIVFALKHSILPADYYIRASVEVFGQIIGVGGAILRMKSEKNNPLNRIFASMREKDNIKTNQGIQKIERTELKPEKIKSTEVKTEDIKRKEVKFEDVKRIVNRTIDTKEIIETSLIKDANLKNVELNFEDVNKTMDTKRIIESAVYQDKIRKQHLDNDE
jgi:hypothetical protein